MKQLWLKRLTPFDRRLVVVLSLLVLGSFLLPLRQGRGARVLVSRGAETIFVAPLDRPQRVELPGPLGLTLLQIAGGAAWVESSPCPQKICVGLGKAQRAGDLLACVPNRLVIRIEGDTSERGYDLLSR